MELIAVSLYKKNSKPPVLITLYSETYCCYPQPSGKLYTVDLYEIEKKRKKPCGFKLNNEYFREG